MAHNGSWALVARCLDPIVSNAQYKAEKRVKVGRTARKLFEPVLFRDRHVVLMGKSVSHIVAVGRSRDALGNTTELRVISCDDTTNGLPSTRLDSRQLESSLFRTLKTELTSNDRAKTEE